MRAALSFPMRAGKFRHLNVLLALLTGIEPAPRAGSLLPY